MMFRKHYIKNKHHISNSIPLILIACCIWTTTDSNIETTLGVQQTTEHDFSLDNYERTKMQNSYNTLCLRT